MVTGNDYGVVGRAAHLVFTGHRACRKGNVITAASNAGMLKMLAERTYDTVLCDRVFNAGRRLFNAALDKHFGKEK